MQEIAPNHTLAILLGASAFPNSKILTSPSSFAKSAKDFRDYLSSARGCGIPETNVLNLFDAPGPPGDICVAIAKFLDDHGDHAKDVIVYYVGHGHIPRDGEFLLAVRDVNDDFVTPTSLRVADLATALRERPRRYRIYLILDCCFSAAAITEFQGPGALDATVSMTKRSFPSGGIALLCSTSSTAVGLAPTGDSYTMFSGALLEVLKSGHRDWERRLSLEVIGTAVREFIRTTFRNAQGLPEVHSPDQREGSVAAVGLFPNAARRATDPPIRELGLEVALKLADEQIRQLRDQVDLLQSIIASLPSSVEMAEYVSRLVFQLDGSAVLERECSGITAKQPILDLEIPYSITVNRGAIDSIHVEKSPGGTRTVSYIERGRAADENGQIHIEGVVRIEGELSENTGFVGYRIRQEIQQNFCRTKEEADALYSNAMWPSEYFGSSAKFDVQRMRVIVDFPPEFQGSARSATPVVFYGQSEVVDEGEMQRVTDNFRIAGRTVTFEIEEPKRGQQYVVAWMPPPASPIMEPPG